ncbi:MAG: hypothetical protein LUD18_11625, partial [Lachnospiraceae bacterium]|nr:hypothetical protein [Lachnospiraceae bacterium]
MQNKRKQKHANYGRIGVIAALIAAIIFIIVAVRSCGAKTEDANSVNSANTEVSENGAYTEAENTVVSTEGEITASTENPTTEPPATEADTEATHDIPDVSGLEYPFTTMSLDWG